MLLQPVPAIQEIPTTVDTFVDHTTETSSHLAAVPDTESVPVDAPPPYFPRMVRQTNNAAADVAVVDEAWTVRHDPVGVLLVSDAVKVVICAWSVLDDARELDMIANEQNLPMVRIVRLDVIAALNRVGTYTG